MPKEIRRTLRIREGDPLEIFTDRDGEIILKKYSPIGELGTFAGEFSAALAQTFSCSAAICDRDAILSAAGPLKKELAEKPVSSQIEHAVSGRTPGTYTQAAGNMPRVTGQDAPEAFSALYVSPILSLGDPVGAVLLITREEDRLTPDACKSADMVAAFLGKLLEQ